MTSKISDRDYQLMAELRRPVETLVMTFYPDRSEIEHARLRQLAWQSIDVLVRTNNISSLRSEKDVRRLILDVKQLGVTDEFVERSLDLAISIYQKMKIEHPGLLRRYRGEV
jgi:hypothetical protein